MVQQMIPAPFFLQAPTFAGMSGNTDPNLLRNPGVPNLMAAISGQQMMQATDQSVVNMVKGQPGMTAFPSMISQAALAEEARKLQEQMQMQPIDARNVPVSVVPSNLVFNTFNANLAGHCQAPVTMVTAHNMGHPRQEVSADGKQTPQQNVQQEGPCLHHHGQPVFAIQRQEPAATPPVSMGGQFVTPSAVPQPPEVKVEKDQMIQCCKQEIQPGKNAAEAGKINNNRQAQSVSTTLPEGITLSQCAINSAGYPMIALTQTPITAPVLPPVTAHSYTVTSTQTTATTSKPTSSRNKSGKTHQCSHCEKTFLRLEKLREHEMLHTGFRPYQCQSCSRAFTSQHKLKVHGFSHTGEKPYKCNYCFKVFAKSDKLKRHERTHTGERPFICNYCQKAFVRKDHLQNHERIHTGEKPHKCGVCGKAFSRIDHCRKHERTHLINRQATQQKKAAAAVATVVTTAPPGAPPQLLQEVGVAPMLAAEHNPQPVPISGAPQAQVQ